MPIPALKLNLAPPPTLWRQKHELLGWGALVLGALCLTGTIGFWGLRLYQARKSAQATIALSRDAAAAARKQQSLVDQLRDVDIAKELPRWKLAERIFTERTLPWSRLTAELERSLVQDVRLKSIQKIRGSNQRVSIKLKGEARSREAEEQFVASLRKNDLFQQVVLEREAERTGGGIDFEMSLPVVDTPSPYQPFPAPHASTKGTGASQSPLVRPSKPSTSSVTPQGPAARPVQPSGPGLTGVPAEPTPQRNLLPSSQGQPINPRFIGRPEGQGTDRVQPRRQPEDPNRHQNNGRTTNQNNLPPPGDLLPGGRP